MPGGTVSKKGLAYADGVREIYAAWPMYARRRQGKVRQSHDIWTALLKVRYEASGGLDIEAYRLLKAPRSANNASTPVKQSKMPPSDCHPSSFRRMK